MSMLGCKLRHPESSSKTSPEVALRNFMECKSAEEDSRFENESAGRILTVQGDHMSVHNLFTWNLLSC